MPNPEAPKGSGRKFRRVTTTYIVSGGANRLAPTITIHKTGRSVTSTEATGLIMENIGKFAGVTRENMKHWFGADPDSGDVAMYLTTGGDAGVMKGRDWGNELGVHLGGVFKEHPRLRPNTRIQCDFELDEDHEGLPCFTFNIYAGLAKKRESVEGGRQEPPKKRRRRKKGEGQGGPSPT